MAPVSDRRVRKTRHALHHALLALVLEKGYDFVTVQDIIDRADVGRSTFYAHFTDKQDLLRSGFENLQAQLRQACPASTDPSRRLFGFSLEFFRHCHDHQHLYWALAGKRGGTLMLRWFADMLTELVHDELTARMPADHRTQIPLEVVVQFAVGAYLSLLTWWIDNGAQHSPEALDRMFHDLAAPGITTALNDTKASTGLRPARR